MEEWSICRICLQSTSAAMKSFPDETHSGIPFDNIYFALVGITPSVYPTFPAKICTLCEEELIKSYKFREKCLETEGKLKDLMNEKSHEASIEVIFPSKACQLPGNEEMNAEEEYKDLPEDTQDEDDTAKQDKIFYKFSRKELKELEFKRIRCKICNEIFRGIATFKDHGCLVQLSEAEESTAKEKFSCDECGKIYSTAISLMLHKDRHKKFKRYGCHLCDNRFYCWLERRTHIHSEHLKKNVCECPYCGKGFNKGIILKYHINEKHLKLMPYQCEVCGKTFKNKSNMKNHLKIHSGAKTCEICGKKLKNEKTFNHHVKTHTDMKNYICPVCSKGFTCNFSMKTHVRKFHPDRVHLLPPGGTIVNLNYLKKTQRTGGKGIN